MKRAKTLKKKLTNIVLLLMLTLSITCLGACSQKVKEDSETKEETVKDKDKKRKEEADNEDIDELKDALKAKLNGEDDEVNITPASVQLSPVEAFNEYLNTLVFVKGRTFTFYTNAVMSDDWTSYASDTKDIQAGVVNFLMDDYDSDGEKELLVCETKENGNIVFSMYEYDGSVKLADQYIIEDDYLSGDGKDIYSFIYKYDSRIMIGFYSDGWVGYYADGWFVNFFGFSYENGAFKEYGNGGFAGSDVYDEPELMGALKDCGINVRWEDLNEINILKALDSNRFFKIGIKTLDVTYDDDPYSMPSSLKREVKFYGYAGLDEVEEMEGYILPNSSNELLTEADLEGLSNEELRIARNEIAARHGRKFKDEELNAYFNSKEWYIGRIEPDDFDTEYELNRIEKENMDFIKKHEK